jgi:hypothetical protein
MKEKREYLYKLDSTPDAQRCKFQHGYSVEVHSSFKPRSNLKQQCKTTQTSFIRVLAAP